MDHIDILRRALRLAWNRKALWLFGAILFLTGGGSFNFPRGQARWHARWTDLPFVSKNWIAWLIAGSCLLLIVIVVGLILRYMAQVALYRLVDEELVLERAATVRHGFELGWDHRALRLFGIDLVIDIPFSLIALLILAFALSPLLLMLIDSTGMRVIAIILTVALGLLALLVLLILGGVVGVWHQLVARSAVLDDRRWYESLKHGYTLFVTHFKDVFLMALLMWGIAIGWRLVMLPVTILLGVVAFVSGGVPAWLIWNLTGARWLAMLVGVPIGLGVFLLPMAVIQGAYQAFHSTVWTITYRELVPALETIEDT
ncbi:MAG: hypothetical protein J7M34_12250 [Anaerolineae bacterium]|nr:hypothetical protein [Anaerolineae bacterium]